MNNTKSYHSVKVVLLAAGMGTRLLPLTKHVPKCLLPIKEKPIIEYWLENIEEVGIADVLINTHYHSDKVNHYLRARPMSALNITVVEEEVLLGSAGTVVSNQKWFQDGSEVLIIYADNFTPFKIERLLDYHRSHKYPISMALFRSQTPSECGIVEVDSENVILSIEEKPSAPVSNLANAGIYVFSPEIFLKLPAPPELQCTDLAKDLLPLFIGEMKGLEIDTWLYDIGTPQRYSAVQNLCLRD